MKSILFHIYLSFLCFLFFSCQSGTSKDNKSEMLSITTNKLNESSQTQKISEASFTCLLNDDVWKGSGFYGSHLYYTKGMRQMYDNKPFLTISFKANNLPDNRQLTISIVNFNPNRKTYLSKDIDVGLSGSATGDSNRVEMQNNFKNKSLSNITVNITEWTQINSDGGLISGTIEGTLPGLKMKFGECCQDVIIKQGVFNNVKVQVYNEKY